ncbi:MAG TPA: hypothetical protein VE079_13150 [Ensifer sp.]|nr:hypothetical protein [Ensifer sp.]
MPSDFRGWCRDLIAATLLALVAILIAAAVYDTAHAGPLPKAHLGQP